MVRIRAAPLINRVNIIMLIRIEDVQNTNELMENKRARFNRSERMLLKVMVVVVALVFVLIAVECVINLVECEKSRMINFT